jgi:hypothetical protein
MGTSIARSPAAGTLVHCISGIQELLRLGTRFLRPHKASTPMIPTPRSDEQHAVLGVVQKIVLSLNHIREAAPQTVKPRMTEQRHDA